MKSQKRKKIRYTEINLYTLYFCDIILFRIYLRGDKTMICLINGIRQHERHFWNCLYGVATQEQIKRILDGDKVLIYESEYQIIENEDKS